MENPDYTKIRQLFRHKVFALRIMGCSPISDECVSKDEGLRRDILSKTHHSLYTIHSRSTKIYKDEKRSGLKFSTYLSLSSLQATFECRLTKHFMEVSVSCPCINATLEGDNVGA